MQCDSCLPGAAGCPMEDGCKLEVRGQRLTVSRVEVCASRPFEWRRLLSQDSILLAIHQAVRGFVGPWASGPDRLGELSDIASLLSCLYVQLCSCPLGWASVGDCLETVCPCKRGRYSTIPKADIPVFLPIVMNAMSLHYPVVTLILSL